MAGAHTHPTDVLVDELSRLYRDSSLRLEGIIAAGLRRGLDPDRLGTPQQRRGDSTLAYRRRQLEQATSILEGIERQARERAPLIIGRAYGAGVVTIDALATKAGAADARVTGHFGRVHVRAVEALAGNMTRALEQAAQRARTNLETVFARADLLDGALPPGARVGGVQFIGRRLDDAYRRVALDTVAGGLIALDTRRQVSARLARRLVNEGVTDALTGFVDRAGRRWSLEAYSEMVARTTTREAASTAVANRMTEHGLDLVTISTHPHPADECTPYEGNTYSLTGTTPGYEELDAQPPFHPRCVHVMYPAGDTLDAFERELERRAFEPPTAAELEARTAPPPPPAPPSPADAARIADMQAARPFPNAQPRRFADSPQRQEAERRAYGFTGPPDPAAVARLIDSDPGREAGAEESWRRWVQRDERAANRALNKALGPDLAKYIDRQWGKRDDVRGRLLRGEMTIEEAEQEAYEHYVEAETRRIMRENDEERNRGFNSGSIPCFSCGKWKRRPSDVCTVCGDDPVPLSGGDITADLAMRNDFDRGFGYAAAEAADSYRSGRGYSDR